MKTQFLLCVAALLMSLSGCERTEDASPKSASPDQLPGTWYLIEPQSPYRVRLTLEKDSVSTMPFSLRISGEASVNLYFGVMNYNAGGLADPSSQIAIRELGATLRGGSSEAMQFEQAYFAALKSANRYELTGQNRLRLHYGGEQTGILVYERSK
ncbi:META domain-containing protein [Spirosoma fluminis]